jgi:PQQ-dependent catabolism-associated CXXCW motif protein
MRRALALLLLGGMAAPAGYRMEAYRAPVPDSVPGGRTITTAQARAMHEAGGAIWIDVLPAPRRPEGLPASSLWWPSPHRGIPGSMWLPEVGRGALAPAIEDWFRRKLASATRGNRHQAIVFYCLSDCWMSWNAAKRAAEHGYLAVHWYPDGADGWKAAGWPTETLQPEPDMP